MSLDVGVVIPALNEERTIAVVVLAARAHGRVFVVDDGSTDSTAEYAAASGALVLRHETNQGYDAALRSGLLAAAHAGPSVLVTLDADGQHDAEVIRRAVECLRGGEASIAIGVRPKFARSAERWFGWYTMRRFGVPDILCGVKAYLSADVLAHRHALGGATIGTGLALALLRAGAKVASFPVATRARSGDSRFGDGVRADARIAAAMASAIVADLRRDRPDRPDTR
jgi:glycosyltransferase involved in cell wall biosynthesis